MPALRTLPPAFDLTDSDRRLRDSEAKYRALVEESGDGIFLFEPGSLRILEGNAALHRLLGAAPGSLVGRTLSEIIAHDPESIRANVRGVLERRGHTIGERDYRKADGSLVRVEVNASAVEMDGRPVVSVVVRDLTERLAARKALEARETGLRAVMECASDGIFIIDGEGRYLEANPFGCAMVGYTLGELQAMTVMDLTHPDHRHLIPSRLALLRNGASLRAERKIQRKDGSAFFMEICATRLPDGRILAIGRDASERMQEEEALRQSQKLESLGLLAGGIAHDFNNLLTALLGNLSLAQIHMAEGHPALRHLQDMEHVALRAADLARQMLAYSGRAPFRKERVDLSKLVEEITQLLSVSVSRKVHLKLDVGSGLPCVEGDPAQLQQVVMNLVTNASEAIGDRSGAIRVHISNADLDPATLYGLRLGQDLPPGRFLVLEVEDTGAGMAPEVQARIFDPFFTTKATGRGLGLSAMLGILKGHKAGLALESLPGVGTRFRVLFSPVESQSPRGLAPDDATLGIPSGTILVVDDDEQVRQTAVAMLHHLGLATREAMDGLDGVAQVAADPDRWSCVILDLTMPRMDGHEALLRIRDLRPELPVVLASGYADLSALPLNGPGTFLPKPFTLPALREALKRVLTPAG